MKKVYPKNSKEMLNVIHNQHTTKATLIKLVGWMGIEYQEGWVRLVVRGKSNVWLSRSLASFSLQLWLNCYILIWNNLSRDILFWYLWWFANLPLVRVWSWGTMGCSSSTWVFYGLPRLRFSESSLEEDMGWCLGRVLKASCSLTCRLISSSSACLAQKISCWWWVHEDSAYDMNMELTMIISWPLPASREKMVGQLSFVW